MEWVVLETIEVKDGDRYLEGVRGACVVQRGATKVVRLEGVDVLDGKRR